MKRLVLILLLANVLTFGWHRGWFDGAGGAAVGVEHEAYRLNPVPLSRLEPGPGSRAPQPKADDAKAADPVMPPPSSPSLPPSSSSPETRPVSSPSVAPTLSPPDARPASSPASDPPLASDPPTPGESASSFVDPPAPSATAVPLVCRAYAPIDEERAQALRNALEQSQARVDAQRVELGSSYLVHLPPAASVQEAQQRLLDVRRIGRDDAFVIQDGPLRMAISLGLFRFESTARVMLEQLERAGETRAVITPRPPILVRIALRAVWRNEGAEAVAAELGTQFDVGVSECE